MKLPFYAVDLSPSGTGKTEVVKQCRRLLLSPVFDMQESLHSKDIERYQEEALSSKGKEKDFIQLPKMHKCIHVTDTSPEALFEAFEVQNAQMVEMGELGRKLKNQKYNGLIDYIVDGYGAPVLVAPNYKNQRTSKIIKIENPNLFFYGDTNLRYLNRGLFFEHLEGGLLNRCFMIFNPHIPEFDEMPEEYEISDFTVLHYNGIAKDLIQFARDNSDHYISVDSKVKQIRKDCEREFYNMRKTLLDAGSPFANLYARSIQNFRTIINIMHLIRSFDFGTYIESLEADTVLEAYRFCKWQFESYNIIIDEVGGLADELRVEDRVIKLINYIDTHKLPITFRELSHAHFGKKSELIKMLADHYKMDKSSVIQKL